MKILNSVILDPFPLCNVDKQLWPLTRFSDKYFCNIDAGRGVHKVHVAVVNDLKANISQCPNLTVWIIFDVYGDMLQNSTYVFNAYTSRKCTCAIKGL